MANKGHVASELLLWASGSQHSPGGTGRLWRTRLTLAQWKEGYSSTNSHPSLGGAISRDTNSLGLPGHPACWSGVLPQPEQSPYSESHKCSNEHPFVYGAEY